MTQARIRISVSAGELEVEGAVEFVDRYAETIKGLLGRLERAPQSGSADKSAAAGGRKTEDRAGRDERDFGEVLHGAPKQATGSDQMLIAGWFSQKSSADSTFTTAEGNRLLIGQGIKLSNAAQAMRGNLAAKRVFKVGGNRWRISKTGDDHLATLISTS